MSTAGRDNICGFCDGARTLIRRGKLIDCPACRGTGERMPTDDEGITLSDEDLDKLFEERKAKEKA